jgi:hypothetical protein
MVTTTFCDVAEPEPVTTLSTDVSVSEKISDGYAKCHTSALFSNRMQDNTSNGNKRGYFNTQYTRARPLYKDDNGDMAEA